MLMKVIGPAATRVHGEVYKSHCLAFAFCCGCEGSSLPAWLRMDPSLGRMEALAWEGWSTGSWQLDPQSKQRPVVASRRSGHSRIPELAFTPADVRQVLGAPVAAQRPQVPEAKSSD